MSEALDEIRNLHTVIDYEREGVVVWFTLKSSESNHYAIRKIEGTDGLMISSVLESDIDGAIKVKVIAIRNRL